MRLSARRRTRLGLALAALALAVPASIGAAQEPDPSATEPRYAFFSVEARADGATAEFEIRGFLPIEELVGISSITSEAHLGVGRSDALAALPDPGDVVLTLPSTLSALAGISGVPDYPAASYSEHPATPEDEVRFAPDADLGGGRLRTTATEDGSSAVAFVGNQVDTVGLIPSFSVGSIKTTAQTRRLNGTSYEMTATSTVNDVRLLGALVRIQQVTSEVTVSVIDGEFEITASDATVSGAELAGTPVGITDDGIVGLGQPQALAPVIDTLAVPLTSAGVEVRTLPSDTSLSESRATAHSGAVEITAPIDVRGYPGDFVLTLGRVSGDVEIGSVIEPFTPPLPDGDVVSPPLDGGGIGTFDPGTSGSLDGAGAQPDTSTDAGSNGGGGQLIAMPAPRTIASWDVLPLYRWMVLAGLVMLLSARWVVRVSRRATRRSDLRPLWRW